MSRSYRALLVGGACVALGLGACEEVSSPSGRNGTVTVQAYVDRDGSGTLTAGDSLLVNFGVDLVVGGEVVESGTTGADGKVTFTDLEPASYRVQATGATPAGAALEGNPAPSAVISARGDSVTVDFRYVFYPGTITGRVFRDDNGDGDYDAGVDTPGPGLKVYLRLNTGGAPGAIVDSTVTDAQGVYTFRLVRPGSYFVTFENPTTIDYGAAGATRAVTVAGRGTATVSAVYTGSLIIKIREARAKAAGSPVAVLGYITSPPGRFGNEAWVQDSTGGIAMFSVPAADSSRYPLGQLVEVSGTISFFAGQVQIGSPVLTARTGTNIFVPLGQTGAQVRALTNDGRLVKVSSVRITVVPATGTNYTVRGVDAAGDTVLIRVHGTSGLLRTDFVVGNEYDITGILTQNNGAAWVKPRFPSDVVLTLAVTPIATARTFANDAEVTVQGNVTVPPGPFAGATPGANSEIWIQDATGGIAVFPVPTSDSTTYRLGDVLRVTGQIKRFSGQVQIGTTGFVPTVTRIGSGTTPAALVQTGPQIVARTEEGKLVTLNNFVVTTVGGGTSGAFTVTGIADGATVQVRISGTGTGLARTNFTVGNSYSITGVLSQFNSTAQIKPRFRTDVTP